MPIVVWPRKRQTRSGELFTMSRRIIRRCASADLERVLFASPATTWEEAADRARYPIELFAATPEGRDPRRRQLIAGALADFARLSRPV